MKLRIKGNSLRLRISQTEMASLLRDGVIEDTIRFAMSEDAKLTYALAHRNIESEIGVDYRDHRVTVLLSSVVARRWASGEDVGVYGSAETPDGPLELIVEKDFACLDRNDPQDADAFPNPTVGSVC